MNLLELNANKLLELLHSNADTGLSSEDVVKNRREFAPSTIPSSKSYWSVFKNVFSDVMPILFSVASLLALKFEGTGYSWFSLFLFAVVYVVFRYISLRYCTKISALLNKSSTRVRVIREGREMLIDYSELVPGDIMLLGFGDVVPCDALVLWQDSLRVSEVQLTGNTSSVIKISQEAVLSGKGVPYYECIIFAGSVVLSGMARVLVCNTGKQVFDKNNKLTSRSKHARRTRIFEITSFVSRQISLIWILVCFLMFVFGVIEGQSVFNVLYLSLTLAVAALPELILTLFDLTLSVGAKRVYDKGCTVRDMSSLDRMCDISCIIVDDSRYFRTSNPKPSTVYVNDERKRFRSATDEDVRELFELAVVASVGGENGLCYNGISVEHSLVDCAEEMGIPQASLYDKYLLLEKRPFTEENGMSRVIVYRDSEFFVVSIGSPSIVLRTCSYIDNHGAQYLGEKERRSVRDMSRVIAQGNEGVVAIAVKKIEYKEGAGQIDNNRDYTLKGYIGLHTAVKADSARAVNVCRKSGIDVVLMTSEGLSTSIGFAKSISLLRDEDKVIENKEYEKLELGVFRADLKSYKVFVWLPPEERAKIASYRKEDGDIIAVTTSGVDDLSLLLEADVSFCPSDVSDEAVRQNSDIIIDGGFELIHECIKYARSVYRNTRHILQYALNFQFVLLFSTLLSILFLGSFTFTPNAIMSYAILVYLPLLFSLAIQGLNGKELKDDFGAQNKSINAQNLLLIPAISAFVSGGVISLSAKAAAIVNSSSEAASGSAFITLVSSAVFMAFALSCEENFDTSVFKNKYLIITALTSFGVLALFTLVPPFEALIGIATPNAQSYALSFATGLVPALVCMGIRLVNKYVINNKK